MDIFVTVRNLVLGLSIAILLPSTVYWGLKIMFPHEENVWTYQNQINTKEKKIKELKAEKGSEEEIEKLEDEIAEIKEHKMEDLKTQQKVELYIYILLGIAAIIFGMFTSITYLGTGFILGGIFTVTTGYMTHWGMIHRIVKFSSLLFAMLIIILFAYKNAATGKKKK